ncbi:MAG: hypothetical protein IPK97_07625 [Ahniella sp.]|nr:hypothetical protein [Ahniella sp.]
MVGALALGEIGWKIENMLNRILDKTIQPTPAVMACLDHAVGALPALLSALRGEQGQGVDIPGIMAISERLAAGEKPGCRSRSRFAASRRSSYGLPRRVRKPVPVVCGSAARIGRTRCCRARCCRSAGCRAGTRRSGVRRNRCCAC